MDRETRRRARAMFRQLQADFRGEQRYVLKQEAQLKKIHPFHSHSGVCHGMSLEWLRRKFLNRRNFNDKKYRWRARTSLIRKIERYHDLYKEAVQTKLEAGTGPAPEQEVLRNISTAKATFQALKVLDGFFYASTTTSDRSEQSVRKDLAELLERARKSPPENSKARIDLEEGQSRAVLISMKGTGKGHAVAIYLAPQDGLAGAYQIAAFDPNMGEYQFNDSPRCVDFLLQLCRNFYSEFWQMTSLYATLVWRDSEWKPERNTWII